MENKVLIISVYFFIAFIVAIVVYAVDDSDHSDFDKMCNAALGSLMLGVVWGGWFVLLPLYLIFKCIDKYVRD